MRADVVLGVIGSVATLVLLFEMMRRHHLREKYAVFWAVIALLTILVAIFPSLLTWAAQLLGVVVPVNLLFFVASMVLLFVSVQHSYEMGRLEDKTRTLAEEIALLRLDVEAGRSRRPVEDPPGRPDGSGDVTPRG